MSPTVIAPQISEVSSLYDSLFPGGMSPGQSAAPQQPAAAPVDPREKYKKSILDFVLDDSVALKKKLGSTDQKKVDEYFNSVRELGWQRWRSF